MVKVMVAEDDKFLTKVYESKFKHEGFDIIIARDGEDVIQKLAADRPDILLLDLVMPKKNGFDVLAYIKTNPSLNGMPVLILSNLGQEADIKKGLELGAVDFIVKSETSISDVVEKIKHHLGTANMAIPERNTFAAKAPILCPKCHVTLNEVRHFCPECGERIQ